MEHASKNENDFLSVVHSSTRAIIAFVSKHLHIVLFLHIVNIELYSVQYTAETRYNYVYIVAHALSMRTAIVCVHIVDDLRMYE